ncbi:MAG: HAMP domain-containing protein, partial [Pseudomonadota bacterium]
MLKPRFSLEGKLALITACGIATATLLTVVLTTAFSAPSLALVISLTAGLAVSVGLLHWIMVPVNRLFQALTDGVANLRDSDFSISIANPRNDELGELTGAYNQLGDIMRAERTNILQRELLL